MFSGARSGTQAFSLPDFIPRFCSYIALCPVNDPTVAPEGTRMRHFSEEDFGWWVLVALTQSMHGMAFPTCLVLAFCGTEMRAFCLASLSAKDFQLTVSAAPVYNIKLFIDPHPRIKCLKIHCSTSAHSAEPSPQPGLWTFTDCRE